MNIENPDKNPVKIVLFGSSPVPLLHKEFSAIEEAEKFLADFVIIVGEQNPFIGKYQLCLLGINREKLNCISDPYNNVLQRYYIQDISDELQKQFAISLN